MHPQVSQLRRNSMPNSSQVQQRSPGLLLVSSISADLVSDHLASEWFISMPDGYCLAWPQVIKHSWPENHHFIQPFQQLWIFQRSTCWITRLGPRVSRGPPWVPASGRTLRLGAISGAVHACCKQPTGASWVGGTSAGGFEGYGGFSG